MTARVRLFLGLAIVGLTFVVYAKALGYPFLRDDAQHFAMTARWERPPARLGEHFREEFWGEGNRSGLYRPLTAATIQATAWATGLAPAPLRAGNILLHACAALLLAAVVRRLGTGGEPSLPSASVTSIPAASITPYVFAFLAAAHPLCSEAVLEVVSRSESQAVIGTLGAAWLLLRATPGAVLCAALAFLAALLSKEGAFAAVPALGYLVVTRLPRRRALAAGAALAGAVAVALWLRSAALGGVVALNAERISPLDNPLVGEAFDVRLLTAIAVLGRYVLLVVWPARLSADYSFAAIRPIHSSSELQQGAGFQFTIGAIALLGALAWFLLALRRRATVEVFGLLLAGGGWFLVSSIALPIGTIMAERLFYMPLFGLLIACAGLADRAVAPASRDSAGWKRRFPLFLLLPLVAFVPLTLRRVRDWESTATLYGAALEVVPESARVQCTVGHALAHQGRLAEAKPFFERALELVPDYGKAHAELAVVLAQGRQLALGYVHFWLAAHAEGATPADQENLEQAQRVLARDPAARNDVGPLATRLADAHLESILYQQMKQELARPPR